LLLGVITLFLLRSFCRLSMALLRLSTGLLRLSL
jgi:hypothetical protein